MNPQKQVRDEGDSGGGGGGGGGGSCSSSSSGSSSTSTSSISSSSSSSSRGWHILRQHLPAAVVPQPSSAESSLQLEGPQ